MITFAVVVCGRSGAGPK
ncbi:hypothetical protein JMJ77_0009552 [Colletotrichum scovillei]|uniref:Uncharacterized protein n=1 Tax=Colletotrichum scovillei TaxID=1209932 RepID=A0A9P7QY08_9PEZI|nr:hypothetical protein JMJ77_0009552 [Colletotrichum scovillei]KAG7052631.1 hypothetical protein JMJ78_0005647 [Colletotrichum scovillei]KAG7064922.1 hypothetical protein JMJ76_0012680 [Colletotrichum scovillei]